MCDLFSPLSPAEGDCPPRDFYTLRTPYIDHVTEVQLRLEKYQSHFVVLSIDAGNIRGKPFVNIIIQSVLIQDAPVSLHSHSEPGVKDTAYYVRIIAGSLEELKGKGLRLVGFCTRNLRCQLFDRHHKESIQNKY